MIGVGDFIFLKGKYVTAKWLVSDIVDGNVIMHTVGEAKKHHVHPELFFYIGKPLWRRGLPAYPSNATLERDYQAFVAKDKALFLAKSLIKLNKRISRLTNSDKILNCVSTIEMAIKTIKDHLRKT
jgi:hypothetical protein